MLVLGLVGQKQFMEELAWEEARPLWIALIAALLLGALIILLVQRWRKRAAREWTSSGEQLTSFRELYERGELSREEYARIRAKLGQRFRAELEAREEAGPPPAAPTPQSPPTEPPPETGRRPG